MAFIFEDVLEFVRLKSGWTFLLYIKRVAVYRKPKKIVQNVPFPV